MKIKFKIWDRKLNKFISWDSLPTHDFDSEEYDYLLYTGIDDIYVGDIIKNIKTNKIYEVLFGSYFTKNDVGHGVHLAEKGDRNGFPKTICNLDFDYEVIGNIYENSELLN